MIFFVHIIVIQSVKTNILSFDGRVNNGSKRKNTILSNEKSPLNCLNAYSNKYGYCIKTIEIADKTNEIPTIEEVVTWNEFKRYNCNLGCFKYAKEKC